MLFLDQDMGEEDCKFHKELFLSGRKLNGWGEIHRKIIRLNEIYLGRIFKKIEKLYMKSRVSKE